MQSHIREITAENLAADAPVRFPFAPPRTPTLAFRIFQRLFDIVFSSIALVLTLPLMGIIALAIKIQAGSPVLFVQERPGKDGKPFRMYKFMTMYPDNDGLLQAYLAENDEARQEWETYRKLKNYDPRVTGIGRFLRKTSLDELPQFFNVLVGDMSVVGPRPYIADEFGDYDLPPDEVKTLLSVKPGITGYWQTTKRNESAFVERVEMDLWYIRHRNLIMDWRIILSSVLVIFGQRGAY